MTDMAVSDWVGREETIQTRVTDHLAAMLAATLAPQEDTRDGAAMPLLWHWAAFPALAPMDQLGDDGHPRRGGFLPPVALPRRMWASGALTFHKRLHVGERITRHSTIREVSEKTGGTGRLVFVTVDHDLHGEDGKAITERQDIVYMPMPNVFSPPKARPVPDAPLLDETVPVSEALLFRYSACTFNAHRIHIDLDYTREVEKYPNLVVHGPLQATHLAALATRWKGQAPDAFEFRGVHPMFHDADMRLVATEDDNALRLCTARGTEHQCLQAKATWETT